MDESVKRVALIIEALFYSYTKRPSIREISYLCKNVWFQPILRWDMWFHSINFDSWPIQKTFVGHRLNELVHGIA